MQEAAFGLGAVAFQRGAKALGCLRATSEFAKQLTAECQSQVILLQREIAVEWLQSTQGGSRAPYARDGDRTIERHDR